MRLKRIARTTTISLVACSLLIAGGALASTERNTVSVMGTYVIPDGNRDANYGAGLHFAVGLPLDQRLTLEPNLVNLLYERDSDASKRDGGVGLGLDLMFSPVSAGAARFHLIGGLGALYEKLSGEHYWSPALNLGAGVRIAIGERFSLRGEARYHGAYNSDYPDANKAGRSGGQYRQDARLNLGLQYALGTVAPVVLAEPAPTPPPPPVTVPRDCPQPEPGAPVDADGCALPVPVQLARVCPPLARQFSVDARGCPVPQKVSFTDINFQLDSVELTAAAQRILDPLSEALRAAPELRLHIVGHTDSVGREAYNMQLSERRANAVRLYLFSRGVDPAQLSASGMGQSAPVADNRTPEGRALNRRVELEITR
jgi:outer membrane protein OmpA-like peptidoglycan-associated protein